MVNALTTAAAVFLFYLVLEALGITCPIKWLTGISCAGCGMSRAYLALLGGDIKLAFYYHPLFVLPAIAFVLYLFRRKLSKKAIALLSAAFIAAFIICYAIRMADPSDDIVVCNPSDSVIIKIFKEIKNVLY